MPTQALVATRGNNSSALWKLNERRRKTGRKNPAVFEVHFSPSLLYCVGEGWVCGWEHLGNSMIKRNVVHEPERIAPGTGLEWPPGGHATSSVNVYAVCQRIVCVHEVCLLELPHQPSHRHPSPCRACFPSVFNVGPIGRMILFFCHAPSTDGFPIKKWLIDSAFERSENVVSDVGRGLGEKPQTGREMNDQRRFEQSAGRWAVCLQSVRVAWLIGLRAFLSFVVHRCLPFCATV